MQIAPALREFFQQTVEAAEKINREELTPDLDRLGQVLGWFEIYALEFANLDLVEELTNSHFEEYLSFWYLRKLGEKTPADALGHLSGINQLLAWFAAQHLLPLDGELKQMIESLQQTLPRLLQLAQTIRLNADNEQQRIRLAPPLRSSIPPVLSSLFQVQRKLGKPALDPSAKSVSEPGSVDLYCLYQLSDLHNQGPAYPVQIPALAGPLIQEGDILELTLRKQNHLWQIAGLGNAYPDLAARYLFK